MMKTSSKRGSALLIVLGMLAFIIVSAVAFSAYMRYARLPSSYLRRTTASRQLVKAALTRAIDEIDYAIANNPHPGVGNQGSPNRNLWKNRVYIGTNVFVAAESTIPVMTLEALAYLPPSLVNEVRYYSRLSTAGQWKKFDFDAGRYAFCAIDVSDYFDVNRMTADRPRSSADNGRISLGYLFENHAHTSSGSGAAAWDEWLNNNFRVEDPATLGFKYDSKVPLVSLADFNLALGQKGAIGEFISPIYNYLHSGAATGFDTFRSDAEADRIARMTFVTDSLFTRSKSVEETGNGDAADDVEILDLAGNGQPFSASFLSGRASGPRGGSTSIYNIMSQSGVGVERFAESIPVLSLVSLYDYLDVNNVPVSLGIPTCERTPMVCGLKPNFDSAKLTVKDPEGIGTLYDNENCEGTPLSSTKTTATREVFERVTYKLQANDLLNGLMGGVNSLIVYPFARPSGRNPESFGVDGRVLLYFTVEGAEMKLRTKTMNSNSANDTDEVIHLRNKTFVTTVPPAWDASTGLFTLNFNNAARQFEKTNVTEEEDVIEEVPLDIRSSIQSAAPSVNQAVLVYFTRKWTQTWNDETGSYEPATRPANAELVKAHCGIPPLTADGMTDPKYANDDQFLELMKGTTKPKLKMNVAIQVRIANSDGKTVDLVPACLADDRVFNDVNQADFPQWTQVSGSHYPVMRFDTAAWVELSEAGLEAAKEGKMLNVTPKAVMVADPRFNHAPESWYTTDSLTKQNWLDTNLSADRAGDIFMEVSNQGYLQSIYELSFLPRYCNLRSHNRQYGNTYCGQYYANPEDGRLTYGIDANAVMNKDMMWRTYDLFGADRADFEGMGISSSGSGYKVNPYTDSTNVMMAAFANTPLNWSLASTNDASDETGIGVGMETSQFNGKYAWNEYSTGGKFAWEDLVGIAGSFMSEMRGSSQADAGYDMPPQDRTQSKNWTTAWEDLWRSDDENTLMGFELSSRTADGLWSTDRKFLYGYWRDSFAARQQLFLIFVRSEPLMMGGGSMSTIPPQLGARAVALVWRDPTAATSSGSANGQTSTGYPHPTRVLFYKPLE